MPLRALHYVDHKRGNMPWSIVSIMAAAASYNSASAVAAYIGQVPKISHNSQIYLGVNNMENLFSPEVPVLLIGAPGIGKTARVQAYFDHAEVILTSTMVEEDISGLPYREGDYDFRTVPAMFRRLAEADAMGKTTVLFFDELDKARRSVADTLLTLIASRGNGAATLPIKTCIAAAANPPEFGGGDGISEAMQSRFATIDYEPDVAAWCIWAETQFNIAQARSIINAIRSGEMTIFNMTGEGLMRRVSSPRTITMSLRALERHGSESSVFEILTKGLLCPAEASQVLHLARHEQNEIMNVATGSARRSFIKNSVVQPVRI